MGGLKEQCVSLKITQLMLQKFTVDENVDHREITVKTKCRLIHVNVLLRKFTLLHDQFHGLSPWRHGFTAAWKSGGAAGATHVQISWISAWIPSEVTRTFFFDLPIWDSNSSSFSCRSFSRQREPTVVGSTSKHLPLKGLKKAHFLVNRMRKTHIFAFDIFFYFLLTTLMWFQTVLIAWMYTELKYIINFYMLEMAVIPEICRVSMAWYFLTLKWRGGAGYEQMSLGSNLCLP